jgi:hypothetical protein
LKSPRKIVFPVGQVLVSLPGYEAAEVAAMVDFLYGRRQTEGDVLPQAVFYDLKLGCFRYSPN